MIMTKAMEAAIHKYQVNGGHWFDRDTMEFWGSSVVSDLIDEKYFISREDNFNRTRKLFSIREFSDGFRNVETVTGFQEYTTKANAEIALEVYLRFDELYKAAGFREREVLNNAEKIVPFEAPKPHDCYTIIDTKGNLCTYDFSSKTFIN